MRSFSLPTFLIRGVLPGALAGCGGGGCSSAGTASSVTELSAAAELGRLIFSDTSLSASGQQSCATCHDPVHGHAQSDNLPVPTGGQHMDVTGFRASPSLRYLKQHPAFFFDKEGTPTGGFDRDGQPRP